jgi:hypothetical protein
MKRYLRNGETFICVFEENKIYGKWYCNQTFYCLSSHSFEELKSRKDCKETTEEDFNQFMGIVFKPKDTTGW